jgi:hypothetical protein
MNSERNNYVIKKAILKYLFVSAFLLTIFLLLCAMYFVVQKDGNGIPDKSTFLYNKNILYIFIFASPILFVTSLILLYFQIRVNTRRGFPFLRLYTIITSPERHLSYILEICTIITLFLLSLSMLTSYYILRNKDIDTLRDFLANGSFINMFSGLFIGVWGLLITVIVMRQQRNEIRGFKRFLEEATLMLRDVYARTSDTFKNEKVYIIDFHPFIGCRSLGFNDHHFKDYLEALSSVASSNNVELIIVCHSENLIKSKFSDKKIIMNLFGKKEEKFTISEALARISEENKVSIWRSDEVGPYHFMIIGEEAIEYLVIPTDSVSNQNHLIASKTIDKSRIDYLERTAFDIISTAIKPVSLPHGCIIDLTKEEPVKISLRTEQHDIKGIKLRFQFEEEDNVGKESVINYKKGYYPDKEDDFFSYSEENTLEIKKSSFPVTEVVYFEAKKNKKTVLFSFDDDLIFLEKRNIEKSIVKNNTYLKIKIKNGTDHESEFSHKVEIKIW